MNRLRKILLYSTGGILLLIGGIALFIKLYLTDERLRAMVEPVLEEQLARDVSIGGFEVKLLRSWPDISIGIEELAIHSPERNNQPAPDLASVQRIWVDMPLMPLVQNKVHVKSLQLDAPRILVEVYEDLSTNIIEFGDSSSSEVEEAPAGAEESPLTEVAIEDIRIRDGQLGYVHADGTLLTLSGLNSDLSARLAETAMLQGQVRVEDVFYETGGISYANNWSVALEMDAEAHMDSAWLRIDQATLMIQDLILDMKGAIRDYDSNAIDVDLALNAPEAPVSSFWSLLPATLTKDVEGLESGGVFEVAANVEGLLTEGSLPALKADLNIRDGSISYPDLPSSITALNLDVTLTNEALLIQQFQAEADGAEMQLTASITEFAAPVLEANVDLEADMARIESYYPLDDSTELSGTLAINSQLNGLLSDAAGIRATGQIAFEDVNYQSTLIEQPVNDLNGKILLDNERLVFEGISLSSGESDLQVDGVLIGYKALLEDSLSQSEEPVLTGTLTSTYLNVTEQISEDTTSSFVGPIELPPLKLDMRMIAEKVEFNGFVLSDASGQLTINEGVLGIEDVSARFMNGDLAASGSFDVRNPLAPAFNGAVSLKQLPVTEFFSSFSQMDAIVQLGAYLEGLFDTEASFGLTLDKDLNPDYTSVIANGLFGARQGSFGTTPLQSAISQYTGLSSLESLSVQEWTHAFRVSGEQMHIQDLSFAAGEYVVNVNGSQSFDGGLNYQVRLEMPESASETIQNAPVHAALGPVVNVVNTSLTDPETGKMSLDLLATGTFSAPEVRLNTEMMKARLTGQASALAASARAEAQARIDSLEQAARERAEAELEEQRQALEDRATDEANQLIGNLLDSTATSLDVDSLKDKGADALKNRLDGLFNRKKRNN